MGLFVSNYILLISSQFGKYSAIELSKRDQIEPDYKIYYRI